MPSTPSTPSSPSPQNFEDSPRRELPQPAASSAFINTPSAAATPIIDEPPTEDPLQVMMRHLMKEIHRLSRRVEAFDAAPQPQATLAEAQSTGDIPPVPIPLPLETTVIPPVPEPLLLSSVQNSSSPTSPVSLSPSSSQEENGETPAVPEADTTTLAGTKRTASESFPSEDPLNMDPITLQVMRQYFGQSDKRTHNHHAQDYDCLRMFDIVYNNGLNTHALKKSPFDVNPGSFTGVLNTRLSTHYSGVPSLPSSFRLEKYYDIFRTAYRWFAICDPTLPGPNVLLDNLVSDYTSGSFNYPMSSSPALHQGTGKGIVPSGSFSNLQGHQFINKIKNLDDISQVIVLLYDYSTETLGKDNVAKIPTICHCVESISSPPKSHRASFSEFLTLLRSKYDTVESIFSQLSLPRGPKALLQENFQIFLMKVLDFWGLALLLNLVQGTSSSAKTIYAIVHKFLLDYADSYGDNAKDYKTCLALDMFLSSSFNLNRYILAVTQALEEEKKHLLASPTYNFHELFHAPAKDLTSYGVPSSWTAPNGYLLASKLAAYSQGPIKSQPAPVNAVSASKPPSKPSTKAPRPPSKPATPKLTEIFLEDAVYKELKDTPDREAFGLACAKYKLTEGSLFNRCPKCFRRSKKKSHVCNGKGHFGPFSEQEKAKYGLGTATH